MPIKILSWLLTPLYSVLFALLMVCFQPVLMLAHFLGYSALKYAIEILNLLVIINLRLIGTRFNFRVRQDLPLSRPLIIVSNHQSMYDIAFLVWTFRRHHPKFIAKRELARWIPSVSFNLRHMGSALIDRGDPRQAIPAIEAFGRYIEENRYCACIFPEGTRAKDGVIKKFKTAGLQALLRTVPAALVLPVVVEGSWKLVENRFLPVPFGCKITLQSLDPIEPAAMSPEELCTVVEGKIQEALGALRNTGND